MTTPLDSVLDDFAPPPRDTQEKFGYVRTGPRAATVQALRELAKITSMDDLKKAHGYMSLAQYRVFAQCERKT